MKFRHIILINFVKDQYNYDTRLTYLYMEAIEQLTVLYMPVFKPVFILSGQNKGSSVEYLLLN